MDLLIAPYTVTKEQADAAPATGTPGWATDGNPSTNKPATQWPAYAFNAMQEELVALIQGGGQTLNRNDNTLLFKAVKALIESNLERFAPLESPEFTGTPTAPTPVVTDKICRRWRRRGSGNNIGFWNLSARYDAGGSGAHQ